MIYDFDALRTRAVGEVTEFTGCGVTGDLRSRRRKFRRAPPVRGVKFSVVPPLCRRRKILGGPPPSIYFHLEKSNTSIHPIKRETSLFMGWGAARGGMWASEIGRPAKGGGAKF